MTPPSPSTANAGQSPARLLRNVVLKATALFLLVNLVFAWVEPLPSLGRLSAYNLAFPGRRRLPYGANPALDHNLSPDSLEAMVASHEISGPSASPNEFRVVLLGDSSVWGFLLQPDQTISAYLNRLGLTLADGRLVRAYNLGYPIMSLMKDFAILDESLDYEPDLVIWLVTLESFPYDKQLCLPLLQHNPETVRELIAEEDLPLDPHDPCLTDATFWDRTLVGQRRNLADWLRLQLYGVLWAATGVDQHVPDTYAPRIEDLPRDDTFKNFGPSELSAEDLAFDILAAGAHRARDIPLLVVNEPIFISQGKNSDVRYNFYYPRWAYDDYRSWLAERSRSEGWLYLDDWDTVPSSEFTDSAIHYSPAGAEVVGHRIGAWIAGHDFN